MLNKKERRVMRLKQNRKTNLNIESNVGFDLYDKIDFVGKLKSKNSFHVLIVNYNQLFFTKCIINDLLLQNHPFDITIFDQNSEEKETKKYLTHIQKNWFREDCELNIVYNGGNSPLNTVWNWFSESTDNKYLAFLNNDIRVCANFVSDSIKIFEKEEKCGIIVHPTNKFPLISKEKIEYKFMDKPYLQGWDFVIRHELYEKIPNELKIWCGDNWIIQKIIKKGYSQVYDISSPIIHYFSKTITKYKHVIDEILKNDFSIFQKKYDDTNIPLLRSNNEFRETSYKGNIPKYFDDRVIVSMTSYPKRLKNIPFIIDTILKQTIKPYKIVINLSEEEYPEKCNSLPIEINDYIIKNNIEVNFISGKNTKVWKKIIPTMMKYKNSLILPIDDDYLYPQNMIEDFLNIYNSDQYNPVSGNRCDVDGLHAHCGSSSLVKYEFFKGYIENVSDELIENCPASDIFYTYVANLNGYKYNRTKNMYFLNLKQIRDDKGYSEENELMKKRKSIIDFLHRTYPLE